MNKPRLEKDVKEVYFMNGYYIIKFDGGVTSTAKQQWTCSTYDQAVEQVEKLSVVDRVEFDLRMLEDKKEKAEKSVKELNKSIEDKQAMLKDLKNNYITNNMK